MYKIPVLFTTWNRIEYTKRSLPALCESENTEIIIVDNASTDGTIEYLKQTGLTVIYNKTNIGIAGAMNIFLSLTVGEIYVGKIDNDTVPPKDWAVKLLSHLIKNKLDLIQARHHIIPATDPNGWQGFTKNMKRDGNLLFNHFIGGSGIVFRRSCVDHIPETENKLQGWREFQRQHPELRKAFAEDVEIKLLDEHGYEDYPEYYKTTKRLV